MVVGMLLALPNVFGEDPALQLSRDDRAAIDQASAAARRGILEAQKLPVEASYVEKDRLVLRFADAGRADQGARRDRQARRQGEYWSR